MNNWVLLRGLMRESRHWGEFPQLLQQHIGADHIITPDFPGNGRLFQQQSLRTIEAMVEFLRADLQQRNIQPPYNVMALSMGAMVSVAWAAKYPQEIAKMVLINTSLASYSPFYHRLRPANYPAIVFAMLLGSRYLQERLILKMTSNLAIHSSKGEALLRQWLAYAKECPTSRTNILRQLNAAMHFNAPQQAPAVPTLVLCAQHDSLVNMKCSIAIAEKWQCEIRVHPHAGHELPLDDGEWVIEQINHWK